MQQLPLEGRQYLHYKGGYYSILCIAEHTETKELMVVYQSDFFHTCHVRSLGEWLKKTEDKKERFVLQDEAPASQ